MLVEIPRSKGGAVRHSRSYSGYSEVLGTNCAEPARPLVRGRVRSSHIDHCDPDIERLACRRTQVLCLLGYGDPGGGRVHRCMAPAARGAQEGKCRSSFLRHPGSVGFCRRVRRYLPASVRGPPTEYSARCPDARRVLSRGSSNLPEVRLASNQSDTVCHWLASCPC